MHATDECFWFTSIHSDRARRIAVLLSCQYGTYLFVWTGWMGKENLHFCSVKRLGNDESHFSGRQTAVSRSTQIFCGSKRTLARYVNARLLLSAYLTVCRNHVMGLRTRPPPLIRIHSWIRVPVYFAVAFPWKVDFCIGFIRIDKSEFSFIDGFRRFIENASRYNSPRFGGIRPVRNRELWDLGWI